MGGTWEFPTKNLEDKTDFKEERKQTKTVKLNPRIWKSTSPIEAKATPRTTNPTA